MEYNTKIKLNKSCLAYVEGRLEHKNLPKSLLIIDLVYNCKLIYGDGPYNSVFFSHIGESLGFNLMDTEYEIIEDKLPVKEKSNEPIITIEKIEQILNDNFDRDDIQDIIKCLKDNLFKNIEQPLKFNLLEDYYNKYLKISNNYFTYGINPIDLTFNEPNL